MTQNPKQLDAATAMMLAADIVQQEGRYNFDETEVPQTCSDTGCVLGWLGFVIGSRCIIETAVRMGFNDDSHFYDVMSKRFGSWHLNPTLAATGLRRLAQERME